MLYNLGTRKIVIVCLWSILAHAQGVQVVPAPVSVEPGQLWIGNDGSWSSFAFQIGTPPQVVRLLISTSTSELDAPLALACQGDPNYPANCEDSRGPHFTPNLSTTWQPNKPANLSSPYYDLNIGTNFNLSGFGEYGFDKVSLGFPGGVNITVNHTIVAGFATPVYWNGLFGVRKQDVDFSSFNDPQSSYLTLLKEQNSIPSLSYGYQAGASYQQLGAGVWGSFIFGGYDTSRFDTATTISNNMTASNYPFTVTIKKIATNGSVSGDQDLYSDSQGGLPLAIDSAVSYIYLPTDVCDTFAEAFNLTYDNNTDLYLVSDTVHTQLIKTNPSVTFTISGTRDGVLGEYDIMLPYASFDLTAAYPLIVPSSRYFPIRRAASVSQYTLGRTFLQETYLIVDYERGNFSISQASWASNPVHIATISSPSGKTASGGSSSSSLSKGAIAGIAVGGLVILLIVVGLFFFMRRRKQKRNATTAKAAAVGSEEEKTESGAGMVELDSKGLQGTYEADSETPMSPPMSGATAFSELADQRGVATGATEMDAITPLRPEMEGTGIPPTRTEMEGTVVEVPRFELQGNDEFYNKLEDGVKIKDKDKDKDKDKP